MSGGRPLKMWWVVKGKLVELGPVVIRRDNPTDHHPPRCEMGMRCWGGRRLDRWMMEDHRNCGSNRSTGSALSSRKVGSQGPPEKSLSQAMIGPKVGLIGFVGLLGWVGGWVVGLQTSECLHEACHCDEGTEG